MPTDSIISQTTDSTLSATSDSLQYAHALDNLRDSTFVPSWDLTQHLRDSVADDSCSIATYCDSLDMSSLLGRCQTIFGRPLEYSVMREMLTVGCLLIAFVMLVCLLAWYKKYLKTQLQNFFFPSNNKTQLTNIKTTAEFYTPALLVIAECVLCGVVMFAYVNHYYDLTLGYVPPIIILPICIGIFATYHLSRWTLYRFVNWIFFRPVDKRVWNGGFALLCSLESLLLLPIVVCSIHLGWDIRFTTIILLILCGLTRFLLLHHSFRVFFKKFYGILHLFAYLCTLEMIPLLILWVATQALSSALIIK